MPRILAELDFAAGLKTRNIAVPAMKATVALDNDAALKGYDTKKEKVVLQSLVAEAYAGLKQSQEEIRAAIKGFDEQLTKKPSPTKEEAAERVKTFTTVCKQIIRAQEARVAKRVLDKWEFHRKRDAALTKINLKFAATIALNTISLAASVTVAALSLGTLAVTLVGAAKTVVSSALLIREFAENRDKAATEVYAIDQALWKVYMGPKMQGKAFKGAKEVAAAVGVPFIDSVGKLETKLEDFLGKSARVDKDRQKLFESANKLLTVVKKIDTGKAGPENSKRITTLGDKINEILDKVGTLAVSIDGDNAFYKTNATRCKVYRQLNGKPINAVAQTAGFAVLAGGILATAKSIVDIATALA